MDANPASEPARSDWHATFDAIQDGICLLDRKGRILQCNRTMRELIRLDQESPQGHRCLEALSGRADYLPECPFQRMLATGKRETTELCLRDRWFEAVADPLQNSDGAIVGAVHILHDVTARKLAEAVLKASEERFRLSFDNASIGKSLTHPDGRLLRVNEALCNMLGYTRAELEVMEFAAITHPDDLEETHAYMRSLLAGECATCRFEKRYFHKDGHIVWADVNTMLLRDADTGAPLHLITQVVDITEHKRAETELREQVVRYRNLANSGSALIWTAGTDKLCTHFNEPWLRFTGRTMEQELGNGWAEGVHPDDFDRCLQTYVTAFDRREPFEMEYRLRHASGEYRWLSDLGTPTYDSEGRFTGYLGHCFDITEQKQALIRVQGQLEELQRWYAAMLGREERIQELKREVNALCSALQQEVRYPSQATP